MQDGEDEHSIQHYKEAMKIEALKQRPNYDLIINGMVKMQKYGANFIQEHLTAAVHAYAIPFWWGQSTSPVLQAKLWAMPILIERKFCKFVGPFRHSLNTVRKDPEVMKRPNKTTW